MYNYERKRLWEWTYMAWSKAEDYPKDRMEGIWAGLRLKESLSFYMTGS